MSSLPPNRLSRDNQTLSRHVLEAWAFPALRTLQTKSNVSPDDRTAGASIFDTIRSGDGEIDTVKGSEIIALFVQKSCLSTALLISVTAIR